MWDLRRCMLRDMVVSRKLRSGDPLEAGRMKEYESTKVVFAEIRQPYCQSPVPEDSEIQGDCDAIS